MLIIIILILTYQRLQININFFKMHKEGKKKLGVKELKELKKLN